MYLCWASVGSRVNSPSIMLWLNTSAEYHFLPLQSYLPTLCLPVTISPLLFYSGRSWYQEHKCQTQMTFNRFLKPLFNMSYYMLVISNIGHFIQLMIYNISSSPKPSKYLKYPTYLELIKFSLMITFAVIYVYLVNRLISGDERIRPHSVIIALFILPQWGIWRFSCICYPGK